MSSVVDLWEAGLGRSALERGLVLGSVGEAASVGDRNAAILSLRTRLFGPSVEALARCPQCGELSEIAFRTDDLTLGSFVGVFEIEGVRLECRRPNSLDLAFVLRFDDEQEAARALARRCVVAASGEVTDPVLDALGDLMDAEDPLAAPSFGLQCPFCGEVSAFLFDPVAFVGAEVAARARHELAEVHELALAYGWTEGETLALSPVRRRMYLEMVRA